MLVLVLLFFFSLCVYVSWSTVAEVFEMLLYS